MRSNIYSHEEMLSVHLSSLKVHIQTIGILVSEKSELQTALQYTQQAARQKTGKCLGVFILLPLLSCMLICMLCLLFFSNIAVEAEELNNRLQATRQRVSELERTLSTVSTQQKQFEKVTCKIKCTKNSYGNTQLCWICNPLHSCNRNGAQKEAVPYLFQFFFFLKCFLSCYLSIGNKYIVFFLQLNKELEKERDNLRVEMFRVK